MHKTRLALLTVLAAVAATASIVPSASAAIRYAGPGGTDHVCTAAEPCDITEAVGNAKTGDEVIVNPGNYALTTTLYTPAQITIRGVPGRPRPRLEFSGPAQNGLVVASSMLRYVEINQAAPYATGLDMISGQADQVIVTRSAGTECTAVITEGTMRNSIVSAPGVDATAVCALAGSYSLRTTSLRNVTAIATGSGGVAIEAAAWDRGNVTVNLVNAIARGGQGGAGMHIRTDGSGAQATLAATHSNFANYWTFGTDTRFINGGGNQGTSPAFARGGRLPSGGRVGHDRGRRRRADQRRVRRRRPAARDRHHRHWRGRVRRRPRPRPPAPPASVTEGSATLSGSVDANGAPTSYHFEYGPTIAYGRTTLTADAGSGSVVSVAAALTTLSPATTYHYRLVATNAGGVTTGADRTFSTLAPPPAPPGPAVTSSAPPAQPFAGVESGVAPTRVRRQGHHGAVELPRRNRRPLLGRHEARRSAAGKLAPDYARQGGLLDRPRPAGQGPGARIPRRPANAHAGAPSPRLGDQRRPQRSRRSQNDGRDGDDALSPPLTALSALAWPTACSPPGGCGPSGGRTGTGGSRVVVCD